MQIHNIRFGFATNSSSTHSIVFFPNGQDFDDCDTLSGCFGWYHFTCASKDAKLHYLAQTVKDSILYHMNIDHYSYGTTPEQQLKSKTAMSLLKEITTDSMVDGGYVDHQSCLAIPMSWDGSFIDLAFFNDLKAYLEQDNIVILGGNDNDDEGHPLLLEEDGEIQHLPFTDIVDYKVELIARKDPVGDYWALFSRKTGFKTRFSFKDFSTKPEKASVPELIDIKITDFCDKGCAFCYQNSTTDGRHASNVKRLANELSDLKVFEVALGGGEPTKHPEFIEILESFREKGIVPNFSTRSLDWLRDNRQWPNIFKYTRAFAYSVQSKDEVENLVSLLKVNGIKRVSSYDVKPSIQYVMGSTTPYDFRQILETASDNHLRITLLDFKEVGRGENFRYYIYKDWLNIVKDHISKHNKSYLIGIDTPLAKKYKKELLDAGVSEKLFDTEEGKFSMYIDAVTGKAGPSSFCPEDQLVTVAKKLHVARYNNDLCWSSERIKEVFQSF